MGIRFGAFTLDLGTRQLTQDGREIHLAPKAFDLLAALIAERPNVLSKSTLQQRLWPDTFVAEANLSNLVAELREALGDRLRRPQWIRTVYRIGYAFCGNAVSAPTPADSTPRGPRGWLEWGRRRVPLSIGAHVIGRDPDADVRLNVATISRRHAKVVLTDREAWLEDCGSKNGTRVGADRVTATPVRLADGVVIHIGSVRLTFHDAAAIVSTETLIAGTS